jgi:hypothetical protein
MAGVVFSTVNIGGTYLDWSVGIDPVMGIVN